MTEYVVLKSEKLVDLMEMVSDFGKNGFMPCGGIAFDPSDNQYMQAVYMPITRWTTGVWASEPILSPSHVITFGSSGSRGVMQNPKESTDNS